MGVWFGGIGMLFIFFMSWSFWWLKVESWRDSVFVLASNTCVGQVGLTVVKEEED